MSASDIKDYFYACGIDEELSSYFCLDGAPGWLVRELEGGRAEFFDLYAAEEVAAAFVVLPMGFKWSFFLAQMMHSWAVNRVLPPIAGLILRDREPGPHVGRDGLVSLPYCDNHAVGEGSAELADGARVAVADHLRSDGFVVHEEEDAALWVENLGFAIDGLTGEVGPTAKRGQRFQLA